MNREEAEKAIVHGRVTGIVVMVFTLLTVLGALIADASGEMAYFNDPLMLLDIAVIGVMTWGIHKRSRLAAVLFLVYFVASKVILIGMTGNFTGVALSFVIIYFLFQAARGCFAWHRIERAENPDYRPMRRRTRVALGAVTVVLVGMISLGLLSSLGGIPSTAVQSGEQVPQSVIDELVENGVIRADEEVLHFYSVGLASIMEGGNVMTPDHLIVYFPVENGDIRVARLGHYEISSVRLLEDEGTLFQRAYRVETGMEGRWVTLYLSSEAKGDERFIEDLRSRTITEQVRRNRVLKEGN